MDLFDRVDVEFVFPLYILDIFFNFGKVRGKG